MKILFNTIFCKIMNLQFCKKKFQWKPEYKKYSKRTNANLLLISDFPFQRWYKLNLLQLKTSRSYPKRILAKSNFTRSLRIINFIGLIENMKYFCFRIWKVYKALADSIKRENLRCNPNSAVLLDAACRGGLIVPTLDKQPK